jgi:hypothetical protein
MKKLGDEDILRKYSEFGGKQGQKFATFKDFRKQFDEYLRARTGRKGSNKPIGRPHTEVFRHPAKKET